MRTKKQTLDGVGHLHDSILALGQSEIKFELTKKNQNTFSHFAIVYIIFFYMKIVTLLRRK